VAGLDIVLPINVKRIEQATEAAPAGTVDDVSHDAGYEAGYQEGKLRAEWEAHRQRLADAEKIQALVRALEKLHAEYETLLAEHLPDLIHGALNRVFRHHPFTPDEVAAEVGALLRDMEQAGRIALECSPAEAEKVQHYLADADAIPDAAKWTLSPNPALAPGEFILKSDLGDVDGRHSSRLRQIHHALESNS
jgi:flagellar biosynthesis/type III secretory pathway protein FliH